MHLPAGLDSYWVKSEARKQQNAMQRRNEVGRCKGAMKWSGAADEGARKSPPMKEERHKSPTHCLEYRAAVRVYIPSKLCRLD